MIAVSLLIFPEAVPSSITGVIDLLNGVNKYLGRTGNAPAFKLELVSERPANLPFAFPLSSVAHKSYRQAIRPDLIIIPSFSVGNDSVLLKNKAITDWIKQMYEVGTEIASMCVGSYFLAEAGLLDGKEAASHWASLEDMRKRYPCIHLKSDMVITDQDGIYTSGGAFSSLKLIVYLIEKFCGREVALWISKMFAIEMDRTNPSYFAVFSGQRRHEDKAILEAQLYIEKHYQEVVGMNELSKLVNMGNRNFIRRFKAATNNTPVEYLQRVRVEAAKKAIEINDKDLPLIIENVGYNDLKAFRMVFKRITGLSPLEYKKKYARNSVIGMAGNKSRKADVGNINLL